MSIPDSARWLELGELYINVSDEHEAQYMQLPREEREHEHLPERPRG